MKNMLNVKHEPSDHAQNGKSWWIVIKMRSALLLGFAKSPLAVPFGQSALLLG
jgi:hypothetical protein